MGGSGAGADAVNHVSINPPQIRAPGGQGLRLTLMNMAAQYEDVIELGRGDPDLATPAHVIAAAQQAIREGRTAPTPVAGMPQLREAIARKLREENDIPASPENVIVTVGGQEALMLVMQALLDPGDEVLMPDPRYTPWEQAIIGAGGRQVLIESDPGDAFNLRAEVVAAAITTRTKALLLVTPGNPTGGLVSPDRLRQIADVAIRHNLIVIADEIYEKFVYDGWQHLSIASLPGIAERTVTLNGFSKSWAMTGLRVGYAAAPANLIAAMTQLKRCTTGPTATVSQIAALAALNGPQEALAEYHRIYDGRRRLLMEALTQMGLDYSEPRGAFYLWTRCESTGLHATELSFLLLKEGHVLIFPGTAFGERWNGYLRVSVLQATARIHEGLERMAAVVSLYRARQGEGSL